MGLWLSRKAHGARAQIRHVVLLGCFRAKGESDTQSWGWQGLACDGGTVRGDSPVPRAPAVPALCMFHGCVGSHLSGRCRPPCALLMHLLQVLSLSDFLGLAFSLNHRSMDVQEAASESPRC